MPAIYISPFVFTNRESDAAQIVTEIGSALKEPTEDHLIQEAPAASMYLFEVVIKNSK